MNSEMNNHELSDYYVLTDNVEELKKTIGALAAVHAEIPLKIVGQEVTGVTTHDILFRVSEAAGAGGFFSRGTIAPEGTEAIIRSYSTNEGSEYLVMETDLDLPIDNPNHAIAS